MHRTTYDLIYDQVRAVYRAVTGVELSVSQRVEYPPQPQQSLPIAGADVVMRHFVELDAFARMLPAVAAAIPGAPFTPPVDVVEHDKELRVELAIPGVERDDVHVETMGSVLVISGVRAGEPPNGHTYRLSEIPRGLFRRVLLLPPEVTAEPRRLEVVNGIVKIYLGKVTAAVAKA
jgi:HSP20 family protein